MNYEKAYNEALERAKKRYYAPNADKIPTYANRVIEEIFPELKESDDEKIRKALVRFHKSTIDVDGIKGEEILAWLEKQGEKKPIMNVPTREVILAIWNLGNEWKELTDGYISTEYGTQLDYIQKHWHESEYYLREKQGEKKATWGEDDEKIITALMQGLRYHQLFNPTFGEVPNAEIIAWFKSLKERLL